MKTNKFDKLTAEDQQLILKICDENPYHIAARIVAKPRSEGGLNLTTSRSALNRYYTHHHPDPRSIEMVGQYADAIRVKGQAHSGAALEALYTLVQNGLVGALQSGKPIAELDREFRTLERIQRCFITDEKRRKEIGARAGKDYREHLELLTVTPEPDFIRKDVTNDPGAGDITAADFDTDSDLDLDIAATSMTLNSRPRKPDSALNSLLKAMADAQQPSSNTPAVTAPHHNSDSLPQPRGPENPGIKTAKPPVIPHFPPNPTSKIPLL